MASIRWRNRLLLGIPIAGGVVGWYAIGIRYGLAIAAGIGLGLSMAVLVWRFGD